MNNITWDDLSISDLGLICINANEKIRIANDSMTKYVRKGWQNRKLEFVPDDNILKERKVWEEIRDMAIAVLDKRIKSLIIQ